MEVKSRNQKLLPRVQMCDSLGVTHLNILLGKIILEGLFLGTKDLLKLLTNPQQQPPPVKPTHNNRLQWSTSLKVLQFPILVAVE